MLVFNLSGSIVWTDQALRHVTPDQPQNHYHFLPDHERVFTGANYGSGDHDQVGVADSNCSERRIRDCSVPGSNATAGAATAVHADAATYDAATYDAVYGPVRVSGLPAGYAPAERQQPGVRIDVPAAAVNRGEWCWRIFFFFFKKKNELTILWV